MGCGGGVEECGGGKEWRRSGTGRGGGGEGKWGEVGRRETEEKRARENKGNKGRENEQGRGEEGVGEGGRGERKHQAEGRGAVAEGGAEGTERWKGERDREGQGDKHNHGSYKLLEIRLHHNAVGHTEAPSTVALGRRRLSNVCQRGHYMAWGAAPTGTAINTL